MSKEYLYRDRKIWHGYVYRNHGVIEIVDFRSGVIGVRNAGILEYYPIHRRGSFWDFS